MLTLGIESTCDETASAVVRGGLEIISNVIASQIDVHKAYGGVVPELACRRHVDLIIPVIDQALREAQCTLDEIDLIAVARGPGLIGALLIGLNTAKAIALATNKPFIGVNHVEAHLYAALMSHGGNVPFPCIGCVVSGGHTALLLIHAIGSYTSISHTVDDAVGEAFDKVAKLLGLPYPGGPEIEALAKEGDEMRYPFRGGRVKDQPLHFSFSGLKTSVLYTLLGQSSASAPLPPISHQEKCDIAASFQRAACNDIVKKTYLAAGMHNAKAILFGGGVTNNRYLRARFEEENRDALPLLWPSLGLSLDNAAMIAGLGHFRYQAQGRGDALEIEPQTRIAF